MKNTHHLHQLQVFKSQTHFLVIIILITTFEALKYQRKIKKIYIYIKSNKI